MNNIAPQSPVMRRLTQQDNPAIARVIRQVSAEYGLTADKGYTVADPNLDDWVVEYDGEVVGGGGIAPLTGSESDICELQKMYFLPAIRGKGLAKKLALMAMEQAREMGFKRCYLETTAFLKEAIGLYEHLGFQHIDYALGCTGHVDCEVRMLREL
ncbi:GNAT family N-acetyltransferase [Escherichia coli]|nr:GNAT family N-acetyltransferase [Escherichia coli]